MTYRPRRVRVVAFLTVSIAALVPGTWSSQISLRVIAYILLVTMVMAGPTWLSTRITLSAGGLEIRRLWQRWYFPADDLEVEWMKLVNGLGRGHDTALNARRRSGGRVVSVPLHFLTKDEIKSLQREVDAMVRKGSAHGTPSG